MGIKIKSTDETHVYISQGGYLAIKQINSLGEDSIVVLSPDQAKLVADELYRQLEDTSWWNESESDERESDQPHDFLIQMNLDAADERSANAEIVTQMNFDASKGK